MMNVSTSGSFRLFRAWGIDVYLHWTWFLMALLQINMRADVYNAASMKVIEYITLFGIVLLHEFGHALACRSVGGRAENIILWPLGGIAYVQPPARPGAFLWSIAAGPLVNLLLAPILLGLLLHGQSAGWQESAPDWYTYLISMAQVNGLMLVFNLLPIYPLDGGQILHAILWYFQGRWRSLEITSLLGTILGGFFAMVTFLLGAFSPFLWILTAICVFVALHSFATFQYARVKLMILEMPRHTDCACPQCGIGPPRGLYWVCDHCQTRFDMFDTRGKCPGCGAWFLHPDCPHCHTSNHVDRWY